jgi:hypothetical protein
MAAKSPAASQTSQASHSARSKECHGSRISPSSAVEQTGRAMTNAAGVLWT